MSKGQVSLFISAGIIVILAIGLYVAFLGSQEGPAIEDSTPLFAQEVKTYVEDCLAQTTEDAALFIAKRGGYFNLPDEMLEGGTPTALYIQGTTNLAPSITVLQQQLGEYINAQLGYCLDFDQFQYTISAELPLASTSISPSEISTTLEMATIVKSTDEETIISRYATKVKSPLGRAHATALEVNQLYLDSPYAICHTCLFDIGQEREFSIDTEMYDAQQMLVTLKNDITYSFGMELPAE